MTTLTDRIEQYDRQDYLALMKAFPDHVEEAVERGRDVALPDREIHNVLVCGMGGSGIAGGLLQHFMFYRSPIPVQSNRFYRVPEWVDEGTLAVIVSYSGNTEETLEAYRDARRRGAACVAVTSNGTLQDKAGEASLPLIPVPDGLLPRASAAYLFVPLIYLLGRLLDVKTPDDRTVNRACDQLRELNDELAPERSDNPAVQLAQTLEGRLPIVHGSQEVTAVLAERFKNQLHENAKVFAAANVFPEMNHNEIMGLDGLAEHPDRYVAVWLRDDGEHARVQRRFEVTRDMLEDAVAEVAEIKSRGRSLLSRFLTLMLHTDYVSYYLALLRGRDPSAMDRIETLKRTL